MGLLPFHDLSLAIVLLALLAAFNEADFVAPPHYVHPIWFVVLLKLLIELNVLTNLHNDVFFTNSWIVRRDALVPLAASEVESSYSESAVDYSSFLSSSVLGLNSSKLGIFIAWHQVNAAFGKLLEKVAWSHLLISQMLKLRFFAPNEFHVERSNLENELQPLGPEIKHCGFIIDASQPPVLIWVVGATGLEKRDWRELH